MTATFAPMLASPREGEMRGWERKRELTGYRNVEKSVESSASMQWNRWHFVRAWKFETCLGGRGSGTISYLNVQSVSFMPLLPIHLVNGEQASDVEGMVEHAPLSQPPPSGLSPEGGAAFLLTEMQQGCK